MQVQKYFCLKICYGLLIIITRKLTTINPGNRSIECFMFLCHNFVFVKHVCIQDFENAEVINIVMTMFVEFLVVKIRG